MSKDWPLLLVMRELATFVRFQCFIETPATGLPELFSLSLACGLELLLCGEPFVVALDWSVCCTTRHESRRHGCFGGLRGVFPLC